MTDIRLNALNPRVEVFERLEAESLQELYLRFLKEYNVDISLEKNFEILVDGIIISRDSWDMIPNKECHVMIALIPRGGDGSILRQIIVIAAIAVTAWATAGTSMMYWAPALAGMAAGLAANALIPPPSLEMGGVGAIGYNYEDSQTFSITSQSNTVSKFGSVPRVYGQHRIYPTIVANPYTSLKVNPTTGELDQYFYGIYDCGLGPNMVSSVLIGETPISNYAEANYRIVDFNKPDVDEGAWDTAASDALAYYKGDVTQDSISAAINQNQNDVGATPDEYTLQRTAEGASNGDTQEVSLTFICPRGLTTYATTGQRGERTIELTVEFSEVGSDVWFSFNDPSQTQSYSSEGQITPTASDSKTVKIAVIDRVDQTERYLPNYDIITESEGHYLHILPAYYKSLVLGNSLNVYYWTKDQFHYTSYATLFGVNSIYYHTTFDTYGYKKGSTTLFAPTFINVNDSILHGEAVFARVKTRTPVPGGYSYELHAPIPYDVTLFEDSSLKDGSNNWHSHFHYRGFDFPEATPFTVEGATNGVFLFSANTAEPVYASLSIVPITTAQIEIRVTRMRSYGGFTYNIIDELSWNTLTTRFDRAPIITDQRHTFIEVNIKATDQLNGNIQNLSVVCTSVLDVYDGSSWSKEATQNPAWVFADLLTGNVNKRAIAKSRLETDTLLEWAAYCDEVPTPPPGLTYIYPRFQCNMLLDYNITLTNLINQITGASQASLNLYDGKYGVLVDKNKTVPIQVFTPRNTKKFSSTRSYVDQPDAVKVKYIDSISTWDMAEVLVYSNGFDETNAVIFEDMDTFACTNNEQAWRYGRYMVSQAILRQETISFEVDFEHLVCTRGDFVLYQQDAMKAGGRPARVKTVSGNEITIDDAFITEGGVSYGYTFRGVSGVHTSTMTITDSVTATLDGDIPTVGDLLVWGEVDYITIECIVKAIVPSSDLSAKLTLVEKAEAIYDAESTGEFEEYEILFSKNIDTDVAPPSEVVDLTVEENSVTCENNTYLYYVDLSWDLPIGIVETYEIYADRGKGYELSDYSTNTSYRYVVGVDYLSLEHSFKVIGVAANGNKLTLGEVTAVSATPESKTAKPSDVDYLYINILNETLQLDWGLVADCDVEHYLLRYSPNTIASWSNSIPLQTVDRLTSSISVQARTGTYLVKCVDWNGNESTNVASAITSIPNLINLNIIEETNDFPDLLGTTTQVDKLSGALVLQEKVSGLPADTEYFSEGYYYYKDFLDLGEIYTVRLQSLIDAEGYTIADIISNWTTLSSVTTMSTGRVSDWDVETQVRKTDELLVIGNWATMSSIDPISEGEQDAWSTWSAFTIGDFTARIFQFRLKLISNKASISPRIFDGIIRSDMVDRIEYYDNIVVPVTGTTFVYDPAFAGPSTGLNIQVTQDDASSGDYYTLSARTLAGFTIVFKDKNDVAVERQCDVAIKGYGRKHTEVI